MFYSTQIDSWVIDRSADELMININVPLDYIIQIIFCRSNTFIDIKFFVYDTTNYIEISR